MEKLFNHVIKIGCGDAGAGTPMNHWTANICRAVDIERNVVSRCGVKSARVRVENSEWDGSTICPISIL
jgi:predicted TPR repeat methyltransferase